MTRNFDGDVRYTFVALTLICAVFVLYLMLYEDHKFADVTIYEESRNLDNFTENSQVLEHDREDFQDFSLENYPNFPANFYVKDAKIPKAINKTCGVFPTLDKILFNNLYWQTLLTEEGEYQLFGAYWDIRAKNKNSPTVRILAMITPLKLTEELYCQYWFKDKVVLSQKIWNYFLWHDQWGGNKAGNYKPYLISCKVPNNYREDPPIAVSLVKEPCNTATNILKITHRFPEDEDGKKEDFAVCVKGLDFHDDISIKLIEWIELLRILGASKIFFYELHVHEEIKTILDYYRDEKVIEITPVTLPGHYPNEPYLQHLFLSRYRTQKRLYELISYNDCFLGNMYRYKYITLLDIDEIIMPTTGTWNDLFLNLTSNLLQKSSYNARNVYFFDDYISEDNYFKDIPTYMHILQHVYRTKKIMGSGLYIKSFHNTDLVLAVHNHFPFYCVESCKNAEIDPDLAKLQHYRKDCVKEIKNCEEMKREKVLDDAVWRFKDELIEKVDGVIKSLKVHR